MQQLCFKTIDFNRTIATSMKREINVLFASSVMIGVIIGSGIFVSPTSILQRTGSLGLSLFVWLVAGLIQTLTALCYTELACMYPQAGGEYAFLKIVLPSKLPAFLVAWIYFIALGPLFYAVLAIISAKYLIQSFYSHWCEPDTLAVTVLSVWILFCILTLNCVYVRYIARIQTAFTVCKILPLAIIVILGFVQLFAYKNTDHIKQPFHNSIWSIGSISSSILTGLFSYGGWQYLFNLCEEVKHPEKVIPRSVMISMSVVILIYLLTIFCYMVVLSPEEMMSAQAVALVFAEKTIGWFAVCIPIFVVLSSVGAMSGSILGGSRILFAAARDGLFPEAVSLVHVKYQTPWISVWLLGFVSIVYILSGDVAVLIDYQVFLIITLFFSCVCCVLYLRWKEPHRKRPYKVPIVLPIITASILLFLMVVNIWLNLRLFGSGLLLLLSGVPVYLIFVLGCKKRQQRNTFTRRIVIILQNSLQVVPDDVSKDI